MPGAHAGATSGVLFRVLFRALFRALFRVLFRVLLLRCSSVCPGHYSNYSFQTPPCLVMQTGPNRSESGNTFEGFGRRSSFWRSPPSPLPLSMSSHAGGQTGPMRVIVRLQLGPGGTLSGLWAAFQSGRKHAQNVKNILK